MQFEFKQHLFQSEQFYPFVIKLISIKLICMDILTTAVECSLNK